MLRYKEISSAGEGLRDHLVYFGHLRKEHAETLKIKWLALQWQTAGLVTLRPLCCSVVFLKLCHLVIDAKGLKKIA